MRSPTDTESHGLERRKDLGLALAVWVPALAVRLVVSGQLAGSPAGQMRWVDEQGYWNWAWEIAQDDWLGGDELFYQDPLYPYILAAFMKFFGASSRLRVIQAAVLSLTAVFVYWAGRRLSGRAAGLAAGLLTAFYPTLAIFDALFLKAGWAALAVALVLWIGGVAAAAPCRKRWWFGLGAGLAAVSLLRANFLLAIPAVMVWGMIVMRGRVLGSRWSRLAAMLLGAAMVIGPVTLRNAYVSGWRQVVLTTCQGGQNFYIGNNPQADGAYTILDFVRPHPFYERLDFAREARRRTGREAMTDQEVSRFWYGQGLEFIRSHPAQAVRLWRDKLLFSLNDYEIPDNLNLLVLREAAVPALKLLPLGWGWLWAMAMAGLLCPAGRARELSLAVALLAVVLLSLVAFFVVDRYRLPLQPAVAILAGHGLIAAVRSLRRRQWGRVAAAVLAAGVGAWVAFWPIGYPSFNLSRQFLYLGNAFVLSRDPRDLRLGLELWDHAMLRDPRLIAEVEAFQRAAPDQWEAIVGGAMGFYEAIRPEDRSAEDWCHLGRWRRYGPDLRPASWEALTTALRLDPRLARAWYEVGLWLATRRPRQAHDRQQALVCFYRALELDPGSASAWSAIGHMLRFRPGCTDTAQAMFEQAEQLQPDRFLERLNARWATRIGASRIRG